MDEKVNRVTTICLLLMILLRSGGDCSPEKCSHKISTLQGVDAIQVTRCDIVCFHVKDKKEVTAILLLPLLPIRQLLRTEERNSNGKQNKCAKESADLKYVDSYLRCPPPLGIAYTQTAAPACHRECMRAPFKKRGHCPDSFDDLPVFVYACVYFCSKDSDCSSTEKCCTHSCGQTCKPASGLLEEKHLPPIPVNLTAREKRKNGVQVAWEMPFSEPNQLVLYVLEERHHLGRFFNERLLGEWSSIYSCRKTSVSLKNIIKPGYWYQFRVASVNINGTRGFSLESEGFMFIRRPKLPKPSKLRVEEVCEKNGTIWGMLRWDPSEAVIPIQKYKIFCGHRLDVEEKSESIFVERASVPQYQLFYQLKNLKKNTDYFIQVQAVAFFGKNSLKSKMSKMLFRTSKMEDQFELADFD